MAKLTTRDRVWSAAEEIAEEGATGSSWSRQFGAQDVAQYMDDPPSEKTIRETLQSMVELGRLDRARSHGQYKFREDLREILDHEGVHAGLREERDRLQEQLADVVAERDELQKRVDALEEHIQGGILDTPVGFVDQLDDYDGPATPRELLQEVGVDDEQLAEAGVAIEGVDFGGERADRRAPERSQGSRQGDAVEHTGEGAEREQETADDEEQEDSHSSSGPYDPTEEFGG